ncbi:MAG: DUF3618 domain-containing protein [Silicimonas sp.]|nr:DUF3618 domain-containing protein [Silicimonas sp.]
MPNDTRTPDEIERDIERERAELARTVDELQDRFSPEAVIREISRGFREHGGDIGSAVTRSVKQNPVGLALTGVGLAWMMFGRSFEGDDDRTVSRSREYDSIGGDDLSELRRTRKRALGEAADADWEDTGDARSYSSAYGRSDPRRGRVATHRSYGSYPDWARHDLDDYDDDGRSMGDRASDAASAVGDAASGAADGVKSTAGSAAAAVGSGARSAGQSVSDAGSRVADGARSAADSASRAAQRTADRAARARNRLARGTEELSEAARERVVAARAKAMHVAQRAERAARENYVAGRDAASDFIEEQPLVAGALALAVGAALAGALPRTRQEDELLGETRDDLFDDAERIFHEERRKAERVANAALDEAGKIADEKRSEIDKAAPGNKSAVEAVADEARDVGRRVKDAAESEADRTGLGKPKT